MREYLIRLIYCEMLGLDCSWGYIHAVKFTQQGNTMDKRIGQLVARCSLIGYCLLWYKPLLTFALYGFDT